jgi:hypothetical protein
MNKEIKTENKDKSTLAKWIKLLTLVVTILGITVTLCVKKPQPTPVNTTVTPTVNTTSTVVTKKTIKKIVKQVIVNKPVVPIVPVVSNEKDIKSNRRIKNNKDSKTSDSSNVDTTSYLEYMDGPSTTTVIINIEEETTTTTVSISSTTPSTSLEFEPKVGVCSDANLFIGANVVKLTKKLDLEIGTNTKSFQVGISYSFTKDFTFGIGVQTDSKGYASLAWKFGR